MEMSHIPNHRSVAISNATRQPITWAGFFLAGGIAVKVVLVWCLLLSATSYFVYWWDKQAARHGRWRVAETTLHVIDFLGGWPGGWAARRRFRHKTRKSRFVWFFWAVAAANVVAFSFLLIQGWL